MWPVFLQGLQVLCFSSTAVPWRRDIKAKCHRNGAVLPRDSFFSFLFAPFYADDVVLLSSMAHSQVVPRFLTSAFPFVPFLLLFHLFCIYLKHYKAIYFCVAF